MKPEMKPERLIASFVIALLTMISTVIYYRNPLDSQNIMPFILFGGIFCPLALIYVTWDFYKHAKS